MIILPVLLAVCKTGPEVTVSGMTETPEISAGSEQPHPAEEEQTDDPVNVSREVYDKTLTEVRGFIDNINRIIGTKNYNRWKTVLSDEYIAMISSPEYLAKQSEMPGLKTRNIVLRTPSDFFVNVVVPSRADVRVDEIEFTADNTVKAYHVDTSRAEKRRLRVYELKKIDGNWKVVN